MTHQVNNIKLLKRKRKEMIVKGRIKESIEDHTLGV